MNKKSLIILVITLPLVFLFMTMAKGKTLTKIELLGKKLYFDINLSNPAGMSCATCHDRKGGWAGPDSKVNLETAIYPGALKPRAGNRKPPTASYTGFNPKLHRNDEEENFVGGLFVDGRATGWEIGDPLAEQAMGPFLNPLEHNLTSKKELIDKVKKSEYASLFVDIYGKESLNPDNVEKAYVQVAMAIAAYERSYELNPFNSRFDDFWRKTIKAGLDVDNIDEKNMSKFKNLGLTDQEVKGLMLFKGKGLCAKCQP